MKIIRYLVFVEDSDLSKHRLDLYLPDVNRERSSRLTRYTTRIFIFEMVKNTKQGNAPIYVGRTPDTGSDPSDTGSDVTGEEKWTKRLCQGVGLIVSSRDVRKGEIPVVNVMSSEMVMDIDVL